MFLKMRPKPRESTVSYATRFREKANGCEFCDAYKDRILEHLIQTIDNKLLIQKCVTKGWTFSKFLAEAGQYEGIQLHDMKNLSEDQNIEKGYRYYKTEDT